jgi:hypothetical protein
LGPNPGHFGAKSVSVRPPSMCQIWTKYGCPSGDHPRHQPRWQPDTMSDGKRRLSVRLRWQLEDIRIVE